MRDYWNSQSSLFLCSKKLIDSEYVFFVFFFQVSWQKIKKKICWKWLS